MKILFSDNNQHLNLAPLTLTRAVADLRFGISGRFGASYIGLTSLLSSAGMVESDINLEELFFFEAYHDKLHKYACIFVHYDKDSLIPGDCEHHLEKLSEYCDIFFVSSSEELAKCPEKIEKIKPFCKLGNLGFVGVSAAQNHSPTG